MTHRRRKVDWRRKAPCAIFRALLPVLLCLAAGCNALNKSDNIYGRLSKHGIERSMGPVEGQEEFDKIKAEFDEKKYATAEPKFKKLAAKYKDKPIEEDAMFYIAECQYNLERYPQAQDSYDELLNKYTTTRYIDQIPRRLFHIAKTWLNSPKSAKEVEQVAFTEEDNGKPVPEAPVKPYLMTLAPNFTDKTRPLFDPEGRAKQALKSIWLKDPTGPLADDALMMSATHSMRRRDFKDADALFDLVRTQYPQSEHCETAYLLGSHVKLLTYQGSGYDGKQLDEARKLTESTLRLFPDLDEKEKLEKKLFQMTEAQAARDWENVQLFLRKGSPISSAFYCEVILREHPNSSYAPRALELLKKLKPSKPAKVLSPQKPLGDEDESEPSESEPAEPDRVKTSEQSSEPEEPTESEASRPIRVSDVEEQEEVKP